MQEQKGKKQERYQNLQRLGQGAQGVIFKAKDTHSNQYVAIKRIKIQDQGVPSVTMREICLLKELEHHPNIVRLKQVSYVPGTGSLDMILELVDYDMKKYLSQHKLSITSYQVKLFLYQLCNGIKILHRDLNPQNILIDKVGNLKIADFGLARAFNLPLKTMTHEIEKLWYRAPELLLGQKIYSLGVDIWSVGCIFAELTERKPLFCGDSEIDQIFKIFQFHGTPSKLDWANIYNLPDFKPTFPRFKPLNHETYFKNFDSRGLDLCMRLLQLDPDKRISMKQALKHPYFDDIRPEDARKYRY